jgi:hypothetical protein
MQGTVAELQERGLLDYVVLDADQASSSSQQDTIDSGRDMIDSARDEMPSPSSRRMESPTRDGTTSPSDSVNSTRGSRLISRSNRARQKTVFTGRAPSETSNQGPRKLVKQEARAKGNVKWRIYKVYLQASCVPRIRSITLVTDSIHSRGYFSWVVLLFLIVGYQGFGLVEKLWLKTWGEAYEVHNSSSLRAHALTAAYSLSHHSLEDNLGEQQHVFGAHYHIPAFFGNISVAPAQFGNMSSTHFEDSWDLPSANANPYFYVAVYAGIVFSAAVMATVNSTVQVSVRVSWPAPMLTAGLIVYSIPARFETFVQQTIESVSF